ncbi:hypothetical protein HYZ64_00190 [Candidatus Berkelbacteria bacterium]|nr:hypothetical protein [Candidatus Berkelbacteria bacterium]
MKTILRGNAMRVTVEKLQAVSRLTASELPQHLQRMSDALISNNREVYDYLTVQARNIANFDYVVHEDFCSTVIQRGIHLGYVLGLAERDAPVISQTVLNRFNRTYFVDVESKPENDINVLPKKLDEIGETVLAMVFKSYLNPQNNPHLTEDERICLTLIMAVIIEATVATWHQLN